METTVRKGEPWLDTDLSYCTFNHTAAMLLVLLASIFLSSLNPKLTNV